MGFFVKIDLFISLSFFELLRWPLRYLKKGRWLKTLRQKPQLSRGATGWGRGTLSIPGAEALGILCTRCAR